jgi:long-subunit fatty acid transport protein
LGVATCHRGGEGSDDRPRSRMRVRESGWGRGWRAGTTVSISGAERLGKGYNTHGRVEGEATHESISWQWANTHRVLLSHTHTYEKK